jgi:hypothetical protein
VKISVFLLFHETIYFSFNFLAHKDSTGRVQYVADNLEYLDQHHWLEEIEVI